MTLGERLRAEGKAEGKLEVAKSLLAEKVEIGFIQKITGLSLAEITEAQKTIS